ncbi:hypothetical protein [Pseudomonas tussilaginis]|uniref:hypothetical protein n=1 Tax=Pseudomonas putida TaxID=303 RepID=UPI0023648487|nr:hypothetical protein [Pseudomonas putida]MDD1978220.1 hypothetical protein [Pseudomonas putida]
MQPHRLFNKALLAIAIAGVLSATIVLVPDSISDSFSAYAKDGGGGGGHGGGVGGHGNHVGGEPGDDNGRS